MVTKSSSTTVLSRVRQNPWILATVILGVALVVILFMKGASPSSTSTVSQDEASQKVISFLNSQVQSGEVTLESIDQENGLYKIVVSYQGQQIPVYSTLDGTHITSTLIATDGSDSSPTTPTTPTGPVEINIGSSPVTGSANAKVTVVEFSDFSCPFCAAASGDNEKMTSYMKQNSPSWEPIVTNLMKDYVQTGKVRFAVKYAYGHSGGHPAQLVAWCLNDQGLYWKFYPLAFAHQDDVEDLTKMITLAKTISGMDSKKLQTCLDSKKYDSRFDAEVAEGTAAGVSGTPAFFVNGKLVEGAVPYSQIKALIDSELAASA